MKECWIVTTKLTIQRKDLSAREAIITIII